MRCKAQEHIFTIKQFKWNEAMVGYSLNVVGLLAAISQGRVIWFTNPEIGSKNAVGLGIFYIVFEI
ncbi:MAG: hypothetical protein H7296_05975 [Bacteroidia bacterium]|nr:hypothetical protein [Bacteroidia bacterium]